MKCNVLKCVGLVLSLQGLLWGDFCKICGLEHKSGQCPKETLEMRLDEFEVEGWDSDVEEAYVQEYELRAQRLRSTRDRHHCRTLKRDLYLNDASDNPTIDPLKADKIYRALLEKCDYLLSEVKSLCDLVQVLNMGQTCKVCKAAQEEEERRLAEQQRLERESLEREEAERRRIAEEEQRHREEEARRPKGVTGQQLVNYVVQHSTPNKGMLANRMVRAKRIQPGITYFNLSQLDPFFHDAFKDLEKGKK